MTARKKPMGPGWVDPDEAPDLTEGPWPALLDAAPVTRGRPKAADPKISTTIRLDADIIRHFRKSGRGWQSRINDVLREWMKARERA